MNGKRKARYDFREAVIKKNKKPKKTKIQKDLEAAHGSPKDTKRMMEHKNLKEGFISKLSKKMKGTDKQIENRKKRETVRRTRKRGR